MMTFSGSFPERMGSVSASASPLQQGENHDTEAKADEHQAEDDPNCKIPHSYSKGSGFIEGT
jgi:hypothetical protein